MNDRWYAAVLAGGVGTRLWPQSRRGTPKQFLRLYGERTMLQATMDRLDGIVPWDRRYVVTGCDYVDLVAEQLPELPPAHILGEPAARNTAPSIGWAAQVIAARDPDAVMCSLASDHVVRDPARFRQVLAASFAHADATGSLMTIGIQPTGPETGYGYIHVGEAAAEYDGVPVHAVQGFREKPARDVAEEYVASGEYLWNASMFAWRTDAILDALATFEPGMSAQLARLGAAHGSADEAETAAACFAQIENIAVDYAVMERAEHVCTVPGDFGWDDIGSWAALGDYWPADAAGNHVNQGDVVSIDSTGNIVQGGDRLIALVGVEDLIVIDTGDAVLVCRRADATAVRRVVDRLKELDRPDLT